jgi:hypothetical protein
MRRSNGVLQVIGELVAIVVLALTGRFVAFAQTTLESGVPLTIAVRALSSGKLSIAAALLPSAFVMGSRFSSCTSCAVVKPSPSV